MFEAKITLVCQRTDAIIKAKIQDIIGSCKSISLETALTNVKYNVKQDPNEPDVRLRIIMLSASYIENCEKLGWKFIDTEPKSFFKRITSVLQTPRLKSWVENALKLEKSGFESD